MSFLLCFQYPDQRFLDLLWGQAIYDPLCWVASQTKVLAEGSGEPDIKMVYCLTAEDDVPEVQDLEYLLGGLWLLYCPYIALVDANLYSA